MKELRKEFPNVYYEERRGKKTLFTKNTFKKNDYRRWDSERSKLCAAILKGVSQIGIKEGNIVLYLGASSGTTPSHISDIVGKDGFLFAVEFSPIMAKDLVFLAEKRKNIAPILADANKPITYSKLVTQADVVYQDIAQKNQSEIFLKNCEMYLKPGGFGLLFVKARSVDVAKKPKEIFMQVRKELEKEVVIVDYRELEPYEKDHCVFVVKKK
ncbi:fibrillarin-like rRNA/tRNA 2'-O-methyltransferase [Candidatus Woesearchaeota archaeon]|nr:fibrillarin-like rRNA/tRNA 2'-O-methyltransferase [Candidatus Woesearchaeota archaeon]